MPRYLRRMDQQEKNIWNMVFATKFAVSHNAKESHRLADLAVKELEELRRDDPNAGEGVEQ